MQLAVISDIHGNSAALEAVLGDLSRRGITQYVNLGDAVSGPLDPSGTAARLMADDMPTVSGNHDTWLHTPPGDMPLWEQWALPELTPAQLDWVRSLPATREVGEVLMTHGTPNSDTENWLHVRSSDGSLREAALWEVAEPAKGLAHPVILSGHTHMPRIARLPDGGPLLVNPGSVGCPAYLDARHEPVRFAETGAPDARYAILEKVGATWQASLHAVPYDPTEMIARAEAKGAAGWHEMLTRGWMRPAPA